MVDIVAHSNGGRCFLSLLQQIVEDAKPGEKPLDIIGKVATTDSYHGLSQVSQLMETARTKQTVDVETVAALLGACRNYVCSPEPFGTEVKSWSSLRNKLTAESKSPMKCISCEVDDHASTNFASEAAIFDWFQEE